MEGPLEIKCLIKNIGVKWYKDKLLKFLNQVVKLTSHTEKSPIFRANRT